MAIQGVNYPCFAAEPKAHEKLVPKVTDFSQVSAEHFLSKNKPAVIVQKDDSGTASFAKDFDRDDYRRIKNNIEIVYANIEQAWPAVAKLIDDERYSITLEFDQSPANHSVGRVCSGMLNNAISVAIFDVLPEDDEAPLRLSLIKSFMYIIHKQPVSAKEWLNTYIADKADLYKIQVDAVAWAMVQVDREPGLLEESRSLVTDRLGEQYFKIKDSKKAVKGKDFFDDRGFEPLP